MSMADRQYIFSRGKRLWCRVKDPTGKWQNERTPYDVGDELKGRAYAIARQASHDAQLRNDPVARMPLVYMIQLIPEHMPGRLKVGYSTEVATRLRKHRSNTPEAKLLACWHAKNMKDEKRAHETIAAIAKRVGDHEIFDVNPGISLEVIKAAVDCVLKRVDASVVEYLLTISH